MGHERNVSLRRHIQAKTYRMKVAMGTAGKRTIQTEETIGIKTQRNSDIGGNVIS